MNNIADADYSGIENLEVMAEAVNYNAFLQRLVLGQLRAGDRLLDFGAGSGTMAIPIAAAGYQLCCIEPDPTLRAYLEASGLRAYANLDPIAPASVDLIYTINVLEHIRDDESAVLALRDRLVPGGRLIAYVPAFTILYSSMDRRVGHVRRYRRPDLARLLSHARMAIDVIGYRDCLGFAAALLFKAFDSNNTGLVNRRALIAYDRCVFPLSRRLDRLAGRWLGKNLFAIARRVD